MKEDTIYKIGDLLEEILEEMRELKDKLSVTEQVITPATAARMLGVTTRTISNYRTSGRLTLCEENGIRGYRLADVKRLKK